uniref:Uncharacterized protein n=1 Tax=Hyaloperonospora arabidopsidis (strain Emoy2) TaxID=559515 RepID=M4BZE0_HYAAE
MLRAINIYGESGSVDVEAMNKALSDVKKVIVDRWMLVSSQRLSGGIAVTICRMRSTVTSVGRGLTSTKSTNLLPCAGRWLPGTRFQALPLPTASATRGFFSTESVISSAVELKRSKDGATEVEEEESELEQELVAQIKKLRVRDPMKISELLDPIEEDETAQPELTAQRDSKRGFGGR